jgi:PAS domain S-box-containing protein
VALALSAPVLLVFTCLPAASLTYGYRARARQTAEAQRSGRLLILSEVLAGRHDVDDLLSTFVSTACDAFNADDAVVVLRPEDGTGPAYAVGLESDGAPYDERREATTDQLLLLGLVGAGPAAQEHRACLPPRWERALAAPLIAGGRHLGVVALGWRSAAGRGGAHEATLLTPVASALAFALRGAEALGSLVDETAKLKAVVDRSSDGILVIDGAGVIEVWSPALAALTGRTAADALGGQLREVVSAVDVHGAELNFGTLGVRSLTPENPRTTVEVGIVRPDGEQRWTRCAHAGVFADGRLIRDVVIVHDVTRERQVDRLKADFIATVSHELRTPVTPIKGYAELLRSRGERMSAEKRAECLDFIVERADHLARLVEDLLLASKISAGSDNPVHQVQLVPLNVVELVRLAVRDVADEGRVRLELGDRPVPVLCDPLRGRQVVVNLVTNALKYSAADQPVVVAVDVRDGDARVSVTDRGRGIPADQLTRVFDKFHRVEDPLRMTTSGTGLGLYIARQLAEAMQGDVTVRSVLGSGSTFVFHLPLHRPAAEPPYAPTPYDHPARQVGSCENLAATGGRGADQRVLEEATWPRHTTATA